MNLTPYRYDGPLSAVTLYVGADRQSLGVLLHPGATVRLPADHEYTLVLLALKHLHPVPTHTKPSGKKPEPKNAAKE